jgi:hypothetical protein
MVGMFSVLLVQALLFADGGLTALFVNTLNLALIPVASTQLWRTFLVRSSSPTSSGAAETWKRRVSLSAALGTVTGNVLGAVSLATLLVVGAGAPARMTYAWLVSVQTLAGVAEGFLALLSVRYLAQRAPSLMGVSQGGALRALDERRAPSSVPMFGLSGVLVVLGLALLLIPFASQVPDALDVVVNQWGRAR